MGEIWVEYGWNMGGVWVDYGLNMGAICVLLVRYGWNGVYQYHKKWKICDFLNLFFDIVKSQVKFDQIGLDWNGMDENGLEWMEHGIINYFQHMEGHL